MKVQPPKRGAKKNKIKIRWKSENDIILKATKREVIQGEC